MRISNRYRSNILITCLICPIAILPSIPASPQIAIADRFIAKRNCPAVRAIKTGANPGSIELIIDRAYPVVGKNKPDPSHYLLTVERAKPVQRWVAKECGVLASEKTISQPIDRPQQIDPIDRERYVLALSWQPSFCETKPNKTECRTQTSDRFDATNFTLHGLWPEGKEYCGVSKQVRQIDLSSRWDKLPPISLSPKVAQELARKMPGFASNLQLHEWYKHGTCYGTTPDRYFQDAMRLQDAINSSQVRYLFANNIDKTISNVEIRSSFERSFGLGAGKKVTIECQRDLDGNSPQGRLRQRRRMIAELQINLAGKIEPNTSMANLIAAGKTAHKNSCPRGEVDRAGVWSIFNAPPSFDRFKTAIGF